MPRSGWSFRCVSFCQQRFLLFLYAVFFQGLGDHGSPQLASLPVYFCHRFTQVYLVDYVLFTFSPTNTHTKKQLYTISHAI